ncbi:MAG: bifunctional riboflavin kinase/FAD synthetase [Gammaproteobacteria bacterium]|nr:bifunctional riboflavin kinase/FAD synthetase [Gammaproteobacteria bacterium]
MELIRGLHNLRERHRGSVATIGAFDGVHRGHQAVLGDVLARARLLGLPATVIVFEPLPREYFAPLQSPPRLMSFREKFAVLRDLGIDRVLRIRFDRSFSAMGAPEFIQTVFVNGLGARHIVVGDDLRFGHDREGNIEMLRKAGARFGFEVEATSTVEVLEERISSTRLRAVLGDGDFSAAERLLGRPYFMTGKVVYGRQLGASIGIPTANLELHRYRAALAGVYIVEVRGIGDALLPAVANVGTRPTVDDGIKANLEVHILDFAQDIYGRTIDVIFRKRIREERKFGSLDELKRRIETDISIARTHFGLEPGPQEAWNR